MLLDDLLQPSVFVLLFVLYWLAEFLRDRELERHRGFRRLALRHHPERQALSEDDQVSARGDPKWAFAVTAEAYEVLSDPFRRAVYDQYGEAGLKRSDRPPDGCEPPYVFHGEPLRTYREFFGTENPYADLLDNLAKPPLRGDCPEARGIKIKDEDVIKPLPLTLNEVFHGGVKKVKIERLVLEGASTTMEEKILSIPIMPGIPSGARIVFPEEGDQGPMKIPADVVFVTEIEPHETFRRTGSDLRMTVGLFLSDALTGTIITINTLDGRVLRVPITSVVTPEYAMRVAGEGLPLVEDPGRRGDLVIDFDIEFPVYLPAASKLLVREALDRRYEMPSDAEEDETGRATAQRILLDGKLYMRANKISQICRPSPPRERTCLK
ncbi:dnaJ homolog subfamily B member 13-like [Copidosoma floridanum]|uniref:dnaJ homolog subfamily B member 13-like n=1 Tax=Copidosoma floridanum TaxID=29053 RepID=UPI0006C9654C|nr:dnaJ homolog subfamily B member 13-like [Copidosoma floridanum]